jgi:hypothetical protein
MSDIFTNTASNYTDNFRDKKTTGIPNAVGI